MSYKKVTSCVLLFCIGSAYAMEKGKDLRSMVSGTKEGPSVQLPEDKSKKKPTSQASQHVVSSQGNKREQGCSSIGAQNAISDVQQKGELQEETHNITVAVNITPENMSYLKMFKRWSPKTFSMTVNGNIVHLDDKFVGSDVLTIPLTDNKLEVTYTYDFGYMNYRGTDRYYFEIPAGMEKAQLEFAWETPPVHVRIPGATFLDKKSSK